MTVRLHDPRPAGPVPHRVAGAVAVALVLALAAVLTLTHRPGLDTPPTSPDLMTYTTPPRVDRPARDPGCHEDEAAIVAPIPGPGLVWECVPVDDLIEQEQAR